MKATGNGSRGRPDFLLLIMTLMLVGFGLVMVFSASSGIAVLSPKFDNDALYFTKRQLVFAIFGIFMMFFIMNLRYQFFKRGFVLLLIPVLLMLLLVPFVSEEVNGARSWFHIGPIGLQPTEFAKLTLILYLGSLITKKEEKFREFKRGLLPVILIICFFCGLIMLQPDLGSSMVLAACATIMILTGGANLKQVLLAGSVAAVAITLMVSVSMAINPAPWQYRVNRFTAFMDPMGNAQDGAFQLISALQALGHGGLTGAGFGGSVQKLHYLDYAYNDFIFAVIAEEFGFIGSALFLLFFLVFLWRGLLVALRCPDLYGTVVGAGIVGLFAIQAFINIGGVTGTIPITGVTLPFISSGGSSLLVSLMSMGVLLSISRESNRLPEKTEKQSTRLIRPH
ncbi:putative lipid II flippase FtsW [Paenibacillus sp. MY03]|jgi:cell division protein FtsW|uniref:Probable peptidoglycan glycosyltransferase FtsW n=1 Tax=Paenibacillus agaridevorans TaxID=171404 RepID=A0A2R5ERC2_9BACL|nr:MULTISPECIES: putative lipid II flippase FtsW [Paenibacillus]OUS76916.1 putative lipid II flippase FtsW [Paenibacillus sp. MY03]QNK54625.1 putative lipid II flippase FtsW [Paenibacillus sp. PAMC21692]GBG06323.1 cell division protein FtsW [Paenibacillus agaridevorans]